jgi:hypothetical protein
MDCMEGIAHCALADPCIGTQVWNVGRLANAGQGQLLDPIDDPAITLVRNVSFFGHWVCRAAHELAPSSQSRS